MEHTGGYDVNFIDEFSDHLICVICQLVFKEPVSFVECGHTFCHSCFDKIKEHAERSNEDVLCPTDRTKIDVNKVSDNKTISRLILDLKVKCDHYLDGCQWIGEVRYLERHLDRDCSIKEKKRTSIFLLQQQKRMERYEKQLEEKGKRMQYLERQLDEKDKRMQMYEKRLQLCEKGLQEKEKRLQLCETRLNEKDKEYESSLLDQLYKKEETIQSNELTGPSQADDALFKKVLSEWNEIRNREEKWKYIVELCKRKEEELLIRWLEANTDLWEFGYEGFTILHDAACHDCAKVIHYICTTGTGHFHINAQTNVGPTSLYYAVMNNKYNAVQALIHHGCDVNVKDAYGDTALDIAEGTYRNGVKRLLQEADAKLGYAC